MVRYLLSSSIIPVLLGVTMALSGCKGVGSSTIVRPSYIVINERMSISVVAGMYDDFVMSPQKVQIIDLEYGQSLIIPVRVDNKNGDSNFSVDDSLPYNIDSGYIDASKSAGYKFTWDKTTLSIKDGGSETFNITIKRVSKSVELDIEKGITVSQIAVSNGVAVTRNYVFEILIKRSK